MLDDITKCLVCDSDNLKKLKYHTKCLNCDSVMGVKNGKTWYEYTIPVDEKIAIAINYDNELDTKMIDDGRRESVYEQILNHPEEDQSLPEEHQVENENQDEVQNDIPL